MCILECVLLSEMKIYTEYYKRTVCKHSDFVCFTQAAGSSSDANVLLLCCSSRDTHPSLPSCNRHFKVSIYTHLGGVFIVDMCTCCVQFVPVPKCHIIHHWRAVIHCCCVVYFSFCTFNCRFRYPKNDLTLQLLLDS